MHPLTRTARATGLFYLGLAVTGILGFVVIRQRLAADDAGETLANLVANPSLARAGVALELGMVVTQTLAAVWFYRLFRPVDAFAAGGIAAFGLVNATIGVASAAMLATALQVATDPLGDPAATAQLLYLISDNLWGAGALFFGLWLIPMGWCVLRSAWMPPALGWLLIAGGVGYLVSAFLRYLAPDAPLVAEALTYPASVGELWMVGYLLVHGVRRHALVDGPAAARTPAAAAT
jgi:hypothetical protein